MTPQEQQIIQGLAAGREEAIGLLYDHYGRALYAVALKIVKGDGELAQDILQEALINVWRNGKKYDPSKGSLFTWVLNITRNKAIDKWRSAGRKQEIRGEEVFVYLAEERGIETVLVDGIDVRDQVTKLPPEHRTLIEMAYFEGYTQDELSKKLELPLGTVKTRMRAAMRELRKLFGT